MIEIPASVSLQNSHWFLSRSEFFVKNGETIILRFHPSWVHIEPFALAMLAAWGRWCQRNGIRIEVENLGRTTDYVWRMHLFDHLGISYTPNRTEREEAGRFLPITQVRNGTEIRGVIGDISALLHLQDNPESLAAVQYTISELLRNVIEHSGSADGAFVCAHNFATAKTSRVTIAVADCGIGIREHLGYEHPAALENDATAITLAMQPGVTGARRGLYGTPDNAGAGLFITRSIAKGSGGYFLVLSGNACYRLRRARGPEEQLDLPLDPVADRHDLWVFNHSWNGTVVSMEIRTDQIEDFSQYFAWIRRLVPSREDVTRRINFS
jgi:anti-sigma regulatory factor (Ser/Thr protein kinase)